MATLPAFSFSALPMGDGGEERSPSSQYKRFRSDDLLCDKLKAGQVTSSETESPLLNSNASSTSYASMLLNPMSNYGKAAIDDIEFSDEDCTYSDGDSVPSVLFSERLKDKLNLDWRCAVIIKLVGKPNSSNALKFMADSLKRKWKLQGPWQLIDLPNDYFVVKFHLHEDMNLALCGGPWIIAGQTLVVQQWKPDFDPFANEITIMAVWVRIVGLPLQFYKEFPMRKIGRLLGNMIKVDKLTLAQVRGQFGRLCVEIDLNKPLVPFVDVEGCRYGVVYEGISMICFNCGCFGHAKANCIFQKSETQPTGVAPVVSETENVATASPMSIGNDSPPSGSKVASIKTKNDDGHGPWMLMSYKNKKRDTGVNGSNKGQNSSGSRFSVLDNDDSAMAVPEADIVKTPTTPKIPPPNDNEPRIVSLWKNLQKKLQDKDPDEVITKNLSARPGSSGSHSSAGCLNTPHPMKDITNGLSVSNANRKLGTPNKTRKNAVVSKMVKGSISGAKSFSISSSEMPSINFKSTSSPVPKSYPTSQCPLVIDPGIRVFDEGSGSLKISIAQVCSDSASATFAQAAGIAMEDHNLKSNDDEASMNADSFSSMEGNMNIS